LANATGSAGIAQAGWKFAGHETGVGTVETDSQKFEGVEAELSTAIDVLQKISDSARGEFEEGSEKQMREALQSIHVAAEQALATESQLLKLRNLLWKS
jgi:hypothetical protein